MTFSRSKCFKQCYSLQSTVSNDEQIQTCQTQCQIDGDDFSLVDINYRSLAPSQRYYMSAVVGMLLPVLILSLL